jgi:cellulose synthase/poly-beta-1,6-N-acetylglucosamine synthase-like glycosyltransferase
MDGDQLNGVRSRAVTWPAVWGDGLAVPEGRGRRRVVQLAAVAAVLVTTAYLAWRVTCTLPGTTGWLAACLLVLEIQSLLSLSMHAFDLWDLDCVPAVAREAPDGLRVAVLIPTYNEPREVLLPTIAAAVALEPGHETWVLDDGLRPWVAELAARLGARYRARTEGTDAKAGNINAVLPDLDVDVIAVFDADHVALAGFLTRTLPYFSDPQVALVQTPQDFYNVDSFEHVEGRGGRRYGEQELFYRALAAGRNRWSATFWCGTNAVLRLAALRDVGGVATGTLTEDIHTTMRMHRRGWRSVYHNEVLARGLAAGNPQQYLSQRLRWGTGAMQVLRAENPALVPGLTVGQRISYLSTLLGWFDSWRTLGFLLLPLATLLTGGLPVAAPLSTFLPWFLAAFGTQRLALRLLARGHSTLWHAMLFEVIRLPANLRATLALFSRRTRPFTVTEKGRGGPARSRPGIPGLLVGLLVAHVAALGWYLATTLGGTPLHYGVPWTAHGAALWLVVNAAILVAAVNRTRSVRFAGERRAAVRFEVSGQARLDAVPAQLIDISLTGASLLAPATTAAPGQRVSLEFEFDTSTLQLPAVVQSVSSTRPVAAAQAIPADDAGLAQVGVKFDNLSASTAAELTLALFRTGITPKVTFPASSWTQHTEPQQQAA